MFSAGDLDVLTRTIFGEARNQNLEGQVAVAWVIRNRTARPQRFGASISDVCLKPLQFSCWNRNDPNFVRVHTAHDPEVSFVKAGAAARMALTDLMGDPTFGADHYCTSQAPPGEVHWPPSWTAGMKRTAIIGDHTFYREQTA